MRVAFVPSAPFLLPDLGGGPTDLRAACVSAVAALQSPVSVIGAAPRNGPVIGSVDTTPWGVRGIASADPLPLALAVGASLLAGREHVLVGVVDGEVAFEGDVLVVADGSATRSEKAPGSFDPRAEPFDEEVARCLRSGDAAGLLALDPVLAAELWVGGLATWQAAARSLRHRRWEGDLHWSGAPYGVYYAVATWVWAG